MTSRHRTPALLLTGALLFAACGDDDAGADADTSATETADTGSDAEPDDDGMTDDAGDAADSGDVADSADSNHGDGSTTDDAEGGDAGTGPDETGADTDTDTDGDDGSTDDDAAAAPFPVEIEHVYGSTTIPEEPQRVVTVGYAEHDFVLDVGVQPVGIRANYDGQPVVVWPWAEDLVTGDEPFLLDQTVINFEAIAALQPDLILAINLRLDENEYETLAAIAPTVARPVGTVEAEVPWRLRQEVIGVALGRVEEAAAAIARTEARFAAVREQHPEFAGLEATLANVQESGMVNTYDLGDARYQFLLDLGFDAPEALEGRADDDLFVSLERLDVIDADVVIWSPAPPERLQAIPTRDALMTAAQERREIIIDPIVSVALVEASPLSLQYVIDRILADLALAADGDPDTVAASALELYGLAADVASDEEQAAIDAWVIALGPEASLEEKARHIADFDSILPAVEAAIEAGNAAGGVEVLPQRATINGDLATVLFDVALGGTVAAEDFTADLTLVDGVWVASRSQVCTYVALIGVQCPAE